jgi:alpha-aminoadipate/glutamate carrier protein LysW
VRRAAAREGGLIEERCPRMAVCPDCEADIEIDEYDVDKGEIISCPECGIDLEVVGLSPLELDVAPQDEEGWEE